MISLRFRTIIVHIFLFLAFFLPIYSWSQYLLVLIPFFLYVTVSDKKLYIGWNYIVLLCLFLSLLFNSFWLIPENFKSLYKVFNLCVLLSLFPFFKYNDIYIRRWFVVTMICIVIFTQIVWLLGLQPIIKLLDNIYPATVSYGQIGVDLSLNIGGRYGGVFHNPNDCSRNITILTAMYFVLSGRNKRIDFLVLFLMCFSIFLTGSRTGIIMFCATVSIYILNQESITKKQKLFILSSVLLVLALIFIYAIGENTRVKTISFNVGKSDRMFYIVEILTNTFNNPIEYAFGNLYQERQSVLGFGFSGGFDSDIGNIIYYYGLASFICLLLFIFSLYKKTGKRFLYCLPPHIVMASTGLFTSFYSAIMIFMLYSMCYIESERNKELSSIEN